MSISCQLRVAFISVIFVLAGCGDSQGPSNAGPANVVIVSASSSSIRVQNIGGAGEFYVEVYDHSFYNGPGGTTGPLIRVGHTDPETIAGGQAKSMSNPGGSATRVLAFTRGSGTTSFYQSSCYGSC
jgi:hypothetical protein